MTALDHDWFPEPVPANVTIRPDGWFHSSFAFRHYRSQRPRGVVVGRPELRLEFLSEEHGVGSTGGRDRVRIGDRLEVIPLHACTCVNMFDVAIGVRGDSVVEELPIAGRGKVT